MAKPIVYVIGTGGTIASNYLASNAKLVASASADDLVATVPEIAEFAEIRSVEHSNITSDLMDTPTVVALGKRLRKVLAEDNVAGAVVTHGTATMEETSYFMDLTLDQEKPVVFTGAMRNLVERDADGPRNILYSAITAAHPESRNRGVLVCFNGEIHSARDAIKIHANQVNAYASRDGGPLGAVSKEGLIFFTRPERRLHIDVDHMKENVQLITMAQGANDLLVRACIAERVDGIVIDGVGAGNVNIPYFHAVCDALDAGIPVVIGHRMLGGTPYFAKGHDGSFRSMIERGAISAGYLSGIKARVLLMVALAYTQEQATLRDLFARVAAPSLPHLTGA
ncbi:MAG: asparaginase [Alphaproteobacteria bacterium]|nr:asparaginase [Alphaproteobacteria bacterium]